MHPTVALQRILLDIVESRVGLSSQCVHVQREEVGAYPNFGVLAGTPKRAGGVAGRLLRIVQLPLLVSDAERYVYQRR